MKIGELLFPPKCVGCRRLLDWHQIDKGAFCADCQKLWESEALEACEHCGKPVKECRCVTSAMERARCSAFCKRVYYRHGMQMPVQNRLIFAIKRSRTPRLFEFCAKALSEEVKRMMEEEAPDADSVIVCHVPRRRAAYLEYGNDQAKLLARALARELSLPYTSLLHRKNRPFTPAQKFLSVKERIRAANTAYVCKKGMEIKGKTVLLVDDIVTTGATMAACTRVLRRAGAKKVLCVCVASDDYNRSDAQEKTALLR
ncbi:MAG: ComF family protein [Clostridia bacterium]|nr:ComF family protein [Clostridia bacterium]